MRQWACWVASKPAACFCTICAHTLPYLQVELSNALLLHPSENVTIDMSSWRGHFGTLMPFYAACERVGGFVSGKKQALAATPDELPGAAEPVPQDLLDVAAAAAGAENVAEGRAGAETNVAVGSLDALGLYQAPVRANGERIDWAAPIRCARRTCKLSISG